MYYIFTENGLLNGAGQCECLDVLNIEVDEELYNDYVATPNKYILGEKEIEIEVPVYDEEGNIIGYETITKVIPYPVLNPNYEEEEKEKERERINNLTCTKRVFALMLQELGVDYITQLKPLIESNPQAQLEWELCVELLRANPMLDLMAMQLGITSEQLDALFLYANGELSLDDFELYK